MILLVFLKPLIHLKRRHRQPEEVFVHIRPDKDVCGRSVNTRWIDLLSDIYVENNTQLIFGLIEYLDCCTCTSLVSLMSQLCLLSSLFLRRPVGASGSPAHHTQIQPRTT